VGATEHLTGGCCEAFYFILVVSRSSGLGFGWRGTPG